MRYCSCKSFQDHFEQGQAQCDDNNSEIPLLVGNIGHFEQGRGQCNA